MANVFRTGTLIAALTALFMGVGYLIGGSSGMVIALAVAAAINLTAYWNADRLMLSIYGARPIFRDEAPRLHDLVARLARRAERHPATAHLFIVNPLHGASLATLFATHPSTAERVRRLEAMAGAGTSREAPQPRPWGGGPWDARPRGPWGARSGDTV